MSASRYPLAMSRDHLLPVMVRKLSGRRIPYVSVCGTVGVILVTLVVLDPLKIAKLGSAFQLMIFALICLAVIVMRESKIDSYDPSFRSPCYPYLQVAGVVLPLLIISDMCWLPIMFSLGLLVGGAFWYFRFARRRVFRRGAIYHVFHHLGARRFRGLDTEFRVILKEKGLRSDDPFDRVVTDALFVELPADCGFQEATRQAAEMIATRLDERVGSICRQFLEGTAVGATPTARGAALPHFRHGSLVGSLLCVARSRQGVYVDPDDPLWGGHAPDHPIHAIFYLISQESDPALHLRILAQIAERVENEQFMDRWLQARDELNLKELLLRDRNFLGLTLEPGTSTEVFIGCAIMDLDFDKCLVALVLRDGATLVPDGRTVLRDMDRLTLIGQGRDIERLRNRLGLLTARQRGADSID